MSALHLRQQKSTFFCCHPEENLGQNPPFRAQEKVMRYAGRAAPPPKGTTKISWTNTFSSGILESELWFKMSWLVQKSTSWKFHILNFTALSLQKVFQQCLLYKQKKSNTCLRAVWWRFRDLNTNESHFYEKEAIGHSFTGFCHTKRFSGLKSQETNLLMKFDIPAWCQATTRSCKLNFKLKDSDLCLVRTMKYNSMFFYQDVPIQ